MAVKLGEMLIKAGLLTPQKLDEVLEYQKSHGGKLGLNLINLKVVKESDITRVLSQQYGVPSINLTEVETAPAWVSRTQETALRGARPGAVPPAW